MDVKQARFLHLMFDEKFIDYYIQQSESVAPNISEYWIITNVQVSSLKYVKSKLISVKLWTESNMA